MIINTKNGNMYTVKIKEINRIQNIVKWYDFALNRTFKSPIHKGNNNIKYCIIRGTNIQLETI